MQRNARELFEIRRNVKDETEQKKLIEGGYASLEGLRAVLKPKMLKGLVLLTLLALSSASPACSLNEDLVNGRCRCDASWTGEDCERLNLLPANPEAGLQAHGELGVFSTWGGSVQRDEHGKYHMLAAAMEHGCGLNAWRPNSAIGHATSDDPAGPYRLWQLIKPHFAHEPELIRGADGSLLVYHIGAAANDTKPCLDPSAQSCQYRTNCSKGYTGPQDPWLSGIGFKGPVAVLRSASPDGPAGGHLGAIPI